MEFVVCPVQYVPLVLLEVHCYVASALPPITMVAR
jgi:hypothetical protein